MEQKNFSSRLAVNAGSLQGGVHKMKYRLTLGAVLVVALLNGMLNAQAAPASFVPFNTFKEGVKAAGSGEFMARPESKVKDAKTFEEMRQHILTMYQGVSVTHSFVLDSDHFDCVPTRQQPAMRTLGLKSIATPPPLSVLKHAGASDGAAASSSQEAGKVQSITSQLDPEKQFDEFGNSVRCEADTIPMRRITLEDMTRFDSLKKFFAKGPDGAGQAPKQGVPSTPGPVLHKYAYTYQYVNNLGGNASLNLWSPYVYTGSNEIFSLNQEWYVGYTGTTQTAEVGWQNYPGYYGGQNSRLFIYYTADNYNQTGCYNLSCGKFVQVNNNWYFGGGFPNYSVWGGAQYDFSAEYYLYAGNWWLALGGTWVGYYPGSVYNGGQLTHNAQIIEFGGETVGSNPWPGMGSGGWGSYGWSYAAYQRNLWYIAPTASTYWDTLTVSQPSSNCYNVAGPYWSSSSGWGIYFYDGGPGGYNCY